ncbi:MAG TPA: response regulator, partial [Nitrospira sp.]|nr:response regulator [Nitrospira sp.]
RTYFLGIFGLGLLGTIFVVGWLINRHVSEPLTRELRDSEERTRSIVNHALDAVVVMDDRGRIIDWNPQAKQIFGWSRDAVLGRKLSDTIIPPSFRAMHEKGLQHYLATGEGKAIGKRLETTALHEDGTEFPIELAITPLTLTTGTTFSGFIRDISERKRAESELRHAKEKAEAATLAKSQFLANMSHEIRTPMNGVLGMAELLLHTGLTPKQQSLAHTVHRSGTALLDIINNILDFSKIEAGKLELEQIAFSVRQIIEETVELLAEPAARKHLELTCLIAADVPDRLRGDPVRLRQILLNLISNAIKFTPEGEVAVRVTLSSHAPSTVTIKCVVTDTGIGILPSAQERLFAAFSQADGSTTRRFGGTGLGLAIVKQLAHLMGGEVGLGSSSEQGSTFWFTARLGQETTSSAAPLESPDLRGTHILVVDDHPANREILEVHLKGWGATVTTADSGATALLLLKEAVQLKTPVHVAILDVHMPGMSGLALAKAIRCDSQHRLISLIALSSLDGLPQETDPQTELFCTWIRKPLRQSLLRQCLIHIRTGIPLTGSSGQAEVQEVPPLNARILLSEDNPVNREVTLGMIDLLKCSAKVANHGREAVEAASQTAFDIVLMDCQMPEMDGFSATAAIRRQEKNAGNGRHVPIIALTANAMEGDRARCLAAGMDDYLAKPFTLTQLRATLTRWLTSDSARRNSSDLSTTAIVGSEEESAGRRMGEEIDRSAWTAIQALQRPGRPDLLARVLTAYLEDSHRLVQQIRCAVQNNDPAALYQAAHRLKSSSAQLGALATATHCKDLETLGRLAQLDCAERLLAPLARTHEASCAIIAHELHTRNTP